MARFHLVITEDPEAGRGLIRGAFGPYFAQPVYNRFLGWLGHEEEAAAIAGAFAAGDREAVAAAFHDALVDGVSLVGTVGEIRERLDEYADAGVDVGALNFIGDPGSIADGLRALAP
jgi:alkanesulfonate monooxygenase SsuD/methylene tetrahydromethanopterin reductase-like flavin-dependent oxidoreductase (luciferase family)